MRLLTLIHMWALNNILDFNQWEPEGVPEQRLNSICNEHSAGVPCEPVNGPGDFGGSGRKQTWSAKGLVSPVVYKRPPFFSVLGAYSLSCWIKTPSTHRSASDLSGNCIQAQPQVRAPGLVRGEAGKLLFPLFGKQAKRAIPRTRRRQWTPIR